ncbi:MAG: RNA polymerase factor sigma-54 [Deltaproteobacteria bacterium]|nr:RNA polymerase factor sigma-54 [Deltaproteobacteria bacterium]
MAYELKQELKLTQSLMMTPQLQLAIKLLQLSRLELSEAVRLELETNPVLETANDSDTAEPSAEGEETDSESLDVHDDSDTAEQASEREPEKLDVDWQTYLEQDRSSAGGVDFSVRDEEDDPVSNIPSTARGLADHLVRQLNISGLDADDTRLGEFIIGNIGEDGYLRYVDAEGLSDAEVEARTLSEMACATGAATEAIEAVLKVVQRFDPIGVGARTLRECLLTQAMELPVRDTVAEEIISSHLDALARKNLKSIAKQLGITVEEVAQAARVINKRLNPSPGAGFGAGDERQITPDVYIHKVGDEYVITLNDDGMPKLKISSYYKRLISAGGGGIEAEAKGYIQERLRSAAWFIKSVHQRQRTIYRVVECIVRFQKEFLDKGLQFLRPLVLRDVAMEIGVHESTVSRVTSNKYVHTPRGIFELKYFFSASCSMTDGSDVTAEYIKSRLGEIIKAEDAKNPLSDMEIVARLKLSGIVLARRTAAKYRESLGVLPSSRRKNAY